MSVQSTWIDMVQQSSSLKMFSSEQSKIQRQITIDFNINFSEVTLFKRLGYCKDFSYGERCLMSKLAMLSQKTCLRVVTAPCPSYKLKLVAKVNEFLKTRVKKIAFIFMIVNSPPELSWTSYFLWWDYLVNSWIRAA